MSICFAILAHTDPESLEDLLANLRYFEPDCIPLVYNGSGDKHLFDGISAPVFPQSRKLEYGFGAPYILDVMEWSLAQAYAYNYFVVWDSDMLLVKRWFKAYLNRTLGPSEYLALEFHAEKSPDVRWAPERDLGAWWQPARLMWPEWPIWQPLLGVDHPYGAYNPGQAMRRTLVEKILAHPRIADIRKAVAESRVIGLAEVLFPTLAAALGADPRSYPQDPYAECAQVQFTHWKKESITLDEVRRSMQRSACYFIHPVKPLTVHHPVRRFLREGRYAQEEV